MQRRRGAATVRVQCRSSNGEAADTTLDRVTLDELVGGLPVREFRWYRGRKHYSGWYWSSTTGRLAAYERIAPRAIRRRRGPVPHAGHHRHSPLPSQALPRTHLTSRQGTSRLPVRKPGHRDGHITHHRYLGSCPRTCQKLVNQALLIGKPQDHDSGLPHLSTLEVRGDATGRFARSAVRCPASGALLGTGPRSGAVRNSRPGAPRRRSPSRRPRPRCRDRRSSQDRAACGSPSRQWRRNCRDRPDGDRHRPAARQHSELPPGCAAGQWVSASSSVRSSTVIVIGLTLTAIRRQAGWFLQPQASALRVSPGMRVRSVHADNEDDGNHRCRRARRRRGSSS
jgi:hypothetical protein